MSRSHDQDDEEKENNRTHEAAIDKILNSSYSMVADEEYVGSIPITPVVSASLLASRQLLAEKGFTFIETLKPGGISGGLLDRYSYKGDDAEVKKLLHDGELLLKTESEADESKETDPVIRRLIAHGKITFQNEFDNIASVLAQNNSDKDLKRPRLLAMEIEGKKFIFNECIYQDPVAKRAANLFDHMDSMKGVDDKFIYTEEAADARGFQARKDQRAAELDKIFEGIVAAQNQLHDRQLLHLDSAGRNYCMVPDGGVKVIDFGASLKMDNDGRYGSSLPYTQIPLAYFDQKALLPINRGKIISIETDLFARRMTMMETLAVYLGKYNHDLLERFIFYKNLSGYPTGKPIGLFLSSIDNETRLNTVFNNLMAEAIQWKQKGDVRGDVVIEQLNKYKPYLTSMPPFTSLAQIRADENKAFIDCVNLDRNIQRLTTILENPAELTKVKSDPQRLREFARDLDACIAECRSKGVQEKMSSSPAYKEFAEMKEKLKIRGSEMKEKPPSQIPLAPGKS